MHQGPPDIETCKRIINSPELRTERSIIGAMVSLAMGGVLTVLCFSVGHVSWIDETPYLSPWCVIGVLVAVLKIVDAIQRIVVSTQDRALVWFATDYLSRHIAGVAKQNARQGFDGKPPEASQQLR